MMGSLRSRMQAGMLAGVAVSLAIFGIGTYTMISGALVGEFDASLTAEAHTLAVSVKRDKAKIRIPLEVQAIPEFQQSARPNYFQFWSDGDMVLRRSPSLGTGDLEPFAGEADELVVRALTLPSGRPGRAAGIRFMPPAAKKKRPKPPVRLPQVAADRIATVFGKVQIRKVEAEKEGKVGLYKVRFMQRDQEGEVRIMADGRIAESKVPATEADLPRPVLDAVAGLARDAAITKVRVSTVHARIKGGKLTVLQRPVTTYDIELSQAERKLEASITADGTVIEMEWKGSGDHDDDEKEPRKSRPLTSRPSARAVTLVVARDASDLEDRLGALRWILAGACAAAMAVALIVTAVLVRRGLKPLDSLAAHIGEISEDNLAERIPPGPMPAELQPVRQRLNDLLDRLQGAFKRERRFTADAAHELRTPLAGIRSTIEVAASRDRPAKEYAQSLAECLDIAKHMQRTVESLLLLSRLDVQQVTFEHEAIALGQLIDSCWQGFADRARQRGLTCRNAVPPDAACMGDRKHLAMVFANLLSNATEYADRDSAIDITARAAAETIEVTVANTASGLTDEQVAHVFDRFWQGDQARSRTGVHAGLGLSLVQRLVAALGGSVSASVDAGGMFSVILALPAATDSP